MYIHLILVVFLILILSLILFKNIKIISMVNIIGMLSLIIIVFSLGLLVNANEFLTYFNFNFYIDSFSLIQLFIISTVSFISAVYSYKYINDELKEGQISDTKAKIYYLLFTIFVFSMIFLAVSNNIMLIWIGLEATTLSTAFLIGFNNNKLSLEAAWKYIILCSIGIAIGLVGIILFIYSLKGGGSNLTLEWSYIVKDCSIIDKNFAKVAFALMFVGIGTKVGFAPMHTWLSDGHSEAPSPISAMMSGILINLALYVIVRFYIIMKKVDGLENLRYLFIIFGCFSLIIATFSILKQTNYKRLLAFSSVENMGIISLGFGFGGKIGIYGALIHSIIHAYGKTLLFLVAGNILAVYKTKRVDRIRGLIKTMPINSILLILGILVISGMPPFASFFSEFKIICSGINNGNYIAVFILAISLLLAFIGFLNVFIKMIFEENATENIKSHNKEHFIPLIISMVFIVFVSCSFNNLLYPIISKAIDIING